MSYTLPAANAADFAFTGVAYTLPGASAADMTFVPTGTPQTGMASGFLSGAAFGSPVYIGPFVLSASGFSTSVFGLASGQRVQPASGAAPTTTFGTPANVPNAVGFRSTQFGTASLMPVHPVGFRSTAFGIPLGVQRWTAIALQPTAHFGTPSTPTNRTQVAAGFTTTTVGYPTAIRYAPAITLQTELASGFRSALFGTPTAHPATAGAATGFTSSAFGTPAAITWGMVTSLGPTARFGLAGATGGDSHRWGAVGSAPTTAFGIPAAKLTGHASAIVPVASFGTPQHGRAQSASSTWRATRFGAPTCVRSNTYIVYGINASGRFGQPRAFNRFNHPATGFTSTQLGTPACVQWHRATMMAPATRFGAALLVRNPECIDRYTASSFGPTAHFGTPSC